MQVITSRIHAVLDYLVGALLIVAPYVLGFATRGPEQWIAQVLGAATIVMALMTRYEFSIAKVIPLPAHLVVDAASGVFLAVSPWVFGFADFIWWPHVLVGLTEIAVVTLSKRQPEKLNVTSA